MAKKVTHQLTDDLDGGPAERTTTFSLDNRAWEIDLSEDNRDRLYDLLSEFMAAGRRVVRKRMQGEAVAPSSEHRPPVDPARRERRKAIREWAKANGYALGDVGRIPAHIIAEYDAAQNGA